jgi:hypothetical protein
VRLGFRFGLGDGDAAGTFGGFWHRAVLVEKAFGEEDWGAMRGLPPSFHPTDWLCSDRFGQYSGIEPCAREI